VGAAKLPGRGRPFRLHTRATKFALDLRLTAQLRGKVGTAAAAAAMVIAARMAFIVVSLGGTLQVRGTHDVELHWSIA
jgi:hypothetical protein